MQAEEEKMWCLMCPSDRPSSLDPVEWCGESVSCPSGRTTRSFVRSTFFADVLLKLSLLLRMYANISDDSSRTRLCSYFLPPSPPPPPKLNSNLFPPAESLKRLREIPSSFDLVSCHLSPFFGMRPSPVVWQKDDRRRR